MAESEQEGEYRYAAFISYRHVEPDRKWAKWLHKALETYRVPKGLRESHRMPARVGRVFRDEEELSACSDLSKEIEEALLQSRHLIVVCSPRTPVSEWVNQEVVRFRMMGRGDKILALLVEGEPADAFPASLREIRRAAVEEGVRADGVSETVEPLAADVRSAPHESMGHLRHFAKLRLLSSVLGCRFDDLRRREQQRQRRRRVAWTSALATLVVILTMLVVFAVSKQREAEAERDRVLRLSDSKVARDLVQEVGTLWPVRTDRAAIMADWLEGARKLLAGRDAHAAARAELEAAATSESVTEDRARRRQARDRLAQLEARADALTSRTEGLEVQAVETRKALRDLVEDDAESRKTLQAELASLRQALAEVNAEFGTLRRKEDELRRLLAAPPVWRFESIEHAWRFQVLCDLLRDLDRLVPTEHEGGLVAEVEARHEQAATLREVSIEAHANVWDAAIEEIAASPEYEGLRITPQEGLIPLGPDPDSGLYEFAHVGSGAVPARNSQTGRLQYAEDSALVLVLVPGATFWMGAQATDPNGPNFDPDALPEEFPVHRVTLTAYFAGKHEVTQGQWQTLTGEANPSVFAAGQQVGERSMTRRNPVEQVSWEDVTLWLGRHRLVLPSEAQWEHACRGTKTTTWYVGSRAAALQGHANIADRYGAKNGLGPESDHTPEVDDGHAVHAPVGSFAPNAFGLYDVHGNVFEWCRDEYGDYRVSDGVDPVYDVGGGGGRVNRGGSALVPANNARSAYRQVHPAQTRSSLLGVRPARAITYEDE